MDELKRLLRRLDGLDGKRAIVKGTPDATPEQRGYVGALRGTPVAGEPEADVSVAPAGGPAGERTASSHTPIFVAALIAAIVSMVTVYLVMAWQDSPSLQGAGPLPPAERVVPSKLEFKPPEPGGAQPRQSNEAVDGLLRRAEQLIEGGEVERARVLLEEAAALGSGDAALKLGRIYDPTQAGPLRFADRQTNPALAKAWYERALALGTREAAGYISDPGGR